MPPVQNIWCVELHMAGHQEQQAVKVFDKKDDANAYASEGMSAGLVAKIWNLCEPIPNRKGK